MLRFIIPTGVVLFCLIVTSYAKEDCGTVAVDRICRAECPAGTQLCAKGECCSDSLVPKTVKVPAERHLDAYCERGEMCGSSCCTYEMKTSTKKSSATAEVNYYCESPKFMCEGGGKKDEGMCCEDVTNSVTRSTPLLHDTTYVCPAGTYECGSAKKKSLKKGGKYDVEIRCCKEVVQETTHKATASVNSYCVEGEPCGKGKCCVTFQEEVVTKKKMQVDVTRFCPDGSYECKKGCCRDETSVVVRKSKPHVTSEAYCDEGVLCGNGKKKMCCSSTTVQVQTKPEKIKNEQCPPESFTCADGCCVTRTRTRITRVPSEVTTTTACPIGSEESHKGCKKVVTRKYDHKSKGCPAGWDLCDSGCCKYEKVAHVTSSSSVCPAGAVPCGGASKEKHGGNLKGHSLFPKPPSKLWSKKGGVSKKGDQQDFEDECCMEEAYSDTVPVPPTVTFASSCPNGTTPCANKCCYLKNKEITLPAKLHVESTCLIGVECGVGRCCAEEIVPRVVKVAMEKTSTYFCSEGYECGHKQCCIPSLVSKRKQHPAETSVSYTCSSGYECGLGRCCDSKTVQVEVQPQAHTESYCSSGYTPCADGCCTQDIVVTQQKSEAVADVTYSCPVTSYSCGVNQCCVDSQRTVTVKHPKRNEISYTCPADTYECEDTGKQGMKCCKEEVVSVTSSVPASRSCSCPSDAWETIDGSGCERTRPCPVYDEVKTGHEKVKAGHEKVKTGHAKVKAGHEKVKTGHAKVKAGHEKAKPAHPKMKPPPFLFPKIHRGGGF